MGAAPVGGFPDTPAGGARAAMAGGGRDEAAPAEVVLDGATNCFAAALRARNSFNASLRDGTGPSHSGGRAACVLEMAPILCECLELG